MDSIKYVDNKYRVVMNWLKLIFDIELIEKRNV